MLKKAGFANLKDVKEKNNEEERFYTNRAIGCDFDNSSADGHTDAGPG
jgi:hypothetical protein